MTNFTGLTPEERERIWQEGYTARKAGRSMLTCDYVPWSPKWSVWIAGYKTADEESASESNQRNTFMWN